MLSGTLLERDGPAAPQAFPDAGPRFPLAALGTADRLLVGCLRRDGGDGRHHAVFLALVQACGRLAADQAFAAFRRFVTTLARRGRRPLRLGTVADDVLRPDELAVLGIVACARRRDEAGARWRAEWLVHGEAVEVCCREARALALALRAAEPKPTEDGAALAAGV